MHRHGWAEAFENSPLDLSVCMIPMGFSTFFTVLYSKDSYARYDMLYQSCCKVGGIINEICMWLMLYFPGERNRKTRWEIGRHAVASEFLLFYSLDGQTLTEMNWLALAENHLVTELEVLEFRRWTGAPRFILPIIKLMETARLALHAREDGVSYDTESKKWRVREKQDLKQSAKEERDSKRDLIRRDSRSRSRRSRKDLQRTEGEGAHGVGDSAWGFDAGWFGGGDGHDDSEDDGGDGGFFDGLMADSETMQDSVTIAVQHTEIFDLVKELRTACAGVNNANLSPPPYLYFHLLNVIILLSLMMLAYSLALQGTYMTLPVYAMCLVVNIGLREVSTSMADPFRGKDGDFPLASWLKGSMEMLIHTTYASRREEYMAETAPVPPEDLVASCLKLAQEARRDQATKKKGRKRGEEAGEKEKEKQSAPQTPKTRGYVWECKADSGWVAYDDKTSESLEKTSKGHLECRFQARHEIQGRLRKKVHSEWEEYLIDWDKYEQVNVRNKKRRPIRRMKLRRGSDFDVELEEPEEPFKKGDEVMITKPDSRMQGETGVVLQAVEGMAKVEVMSASAGVNKGKVEVYVYNHLRLLADNHV